MSDNLRKPSHSAPEERRHSRQPAIERASVKRATQQALQPGNAFTVTAVKPHQSELAMAMEEVELLIAYIAKRGTSTCSQVIETTLEIRNQFLNTVPLSAKNEALFWRYFHALAREVAPATVESIKETSPSDAWLQRHPKRAKRVKRVPVFYGFAVFFLIMMTVCLQTYTMIGVGVLTKSYDLFQERNQVRSQIRELKFVEGLSLEAQKGAEINDLEEREQQLDQEFEANRSLLYRWNQFWNLGKPPEVSFSSYDDFEFTHAMQLYNDQLHELEEQQERAKNEEEQQFLSEKIKFVKTEQNEKRRLRKLNESRNLFFMERLSAVYVVNLLEQYVLPLLFGCLGAFTLVLRRLHSAFQNGTFTLRNLLDYNIRIVLGGVTGISSGMFFSEASTLPNGQFGPMLVAFVVGYNVEILFMVMDDLVSRLSARQQQEQGRDNSKGSQEVNH